MQITFATTHQENRIVNTFYIKLFYTDVKTI